MPARREHADRANSEAKSRENTYDQLQKKTSRPAPAQMDLGFDVTPPSRDDAKHIVEERKKAKQSSTKPKATVIKTPAKKPGTHGTGASSAGKEPTSPVKSPSHTTPSSSAKPTSTAAKSRSTQSRPKAGAKQKPKASPVAHTKRKPVAGTKRRDAEKTVLHVRISLPAFIIATVVLALLAGSAIAWQIIGFRGSSITTQAVAEPGFRSITVEPGMSARQVAALLEDAALVADAKLFERYLELSGDATRLQPGNYLIATGSTHDELADKLTANAVNQSERALTIFAGYTLREIDSVLSGTGIAGSGEFLQAVAAVAYERGLPFSEGWFLSGTYAVPAEGAAITLAIRMQDALNDAIRPYLPALEELDIPLSHVVIIASMIQRETNRIEQMPLIAGVIYNRLRAHMPLGIDATLRYGLDVWDRPLTAAEHESDHPYNTRRTTGLPPTGVGSPSLEALDAAMNPLKHEWFYYLHDKEGTLHLAKTYDEHKGNIAKYLQ